MSAAPAALAGTASAAPPEGSATPSRRPRLVDELVGMGSSPDEDDATGGGVHHSKWFSNVATEIPARTAGGTLSQTCGPLRPTGRAAPRTRPASARPAFRPGG